MLPSCYERNLRMVLGRDGMKISKVKQTPNMKLCFEALYSTHNLQMKVFSLLINSSCVIDVYVPHPFLINIVQFAAL